MRYSSGWQGPSSPRREPPSKQLSPGCPKPLPLASTPPNCPKPLSVLELWRNGHGTPDTLVQHGTLPSRSHASRSRWPSGFVGDTGRACRLLLGVYGLAELQPPPPEQSAFVFGYAALCTLGLNDAVKSSLTTGALRAARSQI